VLVKERDRYEVLEQHVIDLQQKVAQSESEWGKLRPSSTRRGSVKPNCERFSPAYRRHRPASDDAAGAAKGINPL